MKEEQRCFHTFKAVYAQASATSTAIVIFTFYCIFYLCNKMTDKLSLSSINQPFFYMNTYYLSPTSLLLVSSQAKSVWVKLSHTEFSVSRQLPHVVRCWLEPVAVCIDKASIMHRKLGSVDSFSLATIYKAGSLCKWKYEVNIYQDDWAISDWLAVNERNSLTTANVVFFFSHCLHRKCNASVAGSNHPN